MTTDDKIEFDIRNDRDHLAFCRETLDHIARVISTDYCADNFYSALNMGFLEQINGQQNDRA